MRWDLPRPPASLLLMAELAEEHGVSADDCLTGTGLTAAQLRDPHLEVTARQELMLVVRMMEALSHPAGLGLDAGLRYHLSTYGIWGFALVSSPTLRSAAEVGLSFFDLTYSLGRIALRDAGDFVDLVLDAPETPPALRRFFVERDAAAIMVMTSEVLSRQARVEQVCFAFAPPDDVDRYVEVFGVEPSFDAAETVLRFDASEYDQPLPQASELTAALAQEQCRDILASRQARTGLAGRVRDLIVGRLADPPDADEAATTLLMGGRTLRRRLAAEGTSYRELLDEVREHVAEELLITAGLSVEQIAPRLGYVEVTSFSQAFRRWKGVGPREFRSKHPSKGTVRI